MSGKLNYQHPQEIWQILEEISREYGRPNFPSLLHSEIIKLGKNINEETDCDCDDNNKTFRTFQIPQDSIDKIKCIARRLSIPESAVVSKLIIHPLLSEHFSKNGWNPL